MADQLYAVIVENPERENSSDFISVWRKGDKQYGEYVTAIADSVEEAKRLIYSHINGSIEEGSGSRHNLDYEIVPWLEEDYGDPIWIVEKRGSLCKAGPSKEELKAF